MKNTIGKKILTVILMPFVIIFGVLLIFISFSVNRYVTNWTELELKGISEINAADLAGRIYSVKVSVIAAANVLDIIDSDRTQAESIIMSMLDNDAIYNCWLACEPDAFDGMDSEHREDYPGAPSGRFIRSYVKEDGKVITAPDMDETTLDDPAQSPWYTIPRDTGSLYVDIDNEIPNLYDYGLGDEPVFTLSLAVPIHKESQVIGCVGADVLFDVSTFGIDNEKHAAVAVFYPNGRLFYSQNMEYAEESVDTLGFSNADKIKKAISSGDALFLPDEYSVFLDARSYTYIQPVSGGNGSSDLYLYTAIPRSHVFNGIGSVFFLIVSVAVVVLVLVLSMFIYVKIKISKPLQSLTIAADAISQGDLETEITSFRGSKDEIGVLSRSLHRMVEQFRVYIIRLEQSWEELSFFTMLDNFIKADNQSDMLNGLSNMLGKHYSARKVIVVCMDKSGARVLAVCESALDISHGDFPGNDIIDANSGNLTDFIYYKQAEELIGDKKFVYMNKSTVSLLNVKFLDENTQSACIIPMRSEKKLCGFIIMEDIDKNKLISSGAESILISAANVLAEWLIKTSEAASASPTAIESGPQSAKPAEDTAEAYESHVIKALNIEGLDSDAAIETMGGLVEIYEQSLRLLTRLLPETNDKLARFLEEDLKAFGIEIHGLKGSLNSVGAYALGREASRIEMAAKAGDAESCSKYLPPFREALMEMYERLRPVLLIEKEKEPGNRDILDKYLQKAIEAAVNYDALEAIDQMRILEGLSFDSETEAQLNEIIAALEIFDCEQAVKFIKELRRGIG